MYGRRERVGIRPALILLLVLGVQAAAAQATPPGTEPLEVTLGAESLEVVESVEAGFYHLNVEGDDAELEVAVDRIREGATVEEAAERYEALNRSFTEGGHPGQAVEALTEVLVATGGNSMPPMAFELTPGEYIVTASGDGTFQYTSLTVTEAAADAEAPDTSVTVDMMDFAFSIPDELTPGEQTWEVQNVGEQVHHMILVRIDDDRTVDDVMAFLETEDGPPPFQDVGYTAVLSPGVSNYVTFDLQPGAYFAICFLPDYETGQPHFMLGMTDTFTVAEN